MDKYNVLVTVYEVHDRFRRVAERKREQKKTAVKQDHVKVYNMFIFSEFYCQVTKKRLQRTRL